MAQVRGVGAGADADIRSRFEAAVAELGAWSGHNIDLGGGVTTIPGNDPRKEMALRRVVQLVKDAAGDTPLEQMRILDLGCLEGLYGLELASQGATVVGIEGRETSRAKAEFAKDVLGLDRIRFELGDVRELSPEKDGMFDVVLCLGVLYHLDPEGVFRLVRAMGQVCTRFAIIHTHVSVAPVRHWTNEGHEYSGRLFLEFLPGTATDQKKAALWGSLDNDSSCWLTKASLTNLLEDAGFTSVLECRAPYLDTQPDDHVTFLAIKGRAVQLQRAPAVNHLPPARRPERRPVRIHPGQHWYYPIARRLAHLIPGKQMLRRLLRIDWHRRAD